MYWGRAVFQQLTFTVRRNMRKIYGKGGIGKSTPGTARRVP
jgi:ABC-type molybdenum transport system ATPase subunit/photorepair protein PhrA